MKSLRATALVSLCLVPCIGFAADFRGVFKAGLEGGGDSLVAFQTSNGGDSLKAGEGLSLGGGVSFVYWDNNVLETEVTINWKYNGIEATNGDLDFTRYPLELLEFYRFQHVRVGGGLTYHLNPSLEGGGVTSNVNVDYKDALGFIVQADWRITDTLNLGARFTALEYERADRGTVSSAYAQIHSGDTVGANSFGLIFTAAF